MKSIISLTIVSLFHKIYLFIGLLLKYFLGHVSLDIPKKFIYYREEDMWIGWLEEFPDYKTQGETLEELKDNLKDIYEELRRSK